jgi:PEP-CTERM motif
MVAAAALSAASVPAAAGPCTTAALDTYISGPNTGCMVLDKTITGMSLSSFVLSASSVTVQPIATANDLGLMFILSDFGTDNIRIATISFTITAPSSDSITGASLAVAGTLFNPLVSFFQNSETLSNGASLAASNSQLTDSASFPAAMSLTVTNALTVALAANFTQFTNQFSETPLAAPEPSALALLGIGLSALYLVRRRKHV